jgi:hypothetical protein
VRRILCRYGNSCREPKIFVIIIVNFGDRPAGCIAIAAIRETAKKFGEGGRRALVLEKQNIPVCG